MIYHTHREICEAAGRWLRNKAHCGAVLVEPVAAYIEETPDAIGWNGGASFLIEAKTTRADMRADAMKPFRKYPEMGMGLFRYIACDEGVLSVNDIPDRWGLIVMGPRGGMRVVHGYNTYSWNTAEGFQHEYNIDSERLLLISSLRKGQVDGWDGVSRRTNKNNLATTHLFPGD